MQKLYEEFEFMVALTQLELGIAIIRREHRFLSMLLLDIVDIVKLALTAQRL